MPLTFNAVELYVVAITEKPWTSAKEVCRALGYNATRSKTENTISTHCSPENITQKYQMSIIHSACTPINWSKDSQKYDIYINGEGMSEVLFSSQQPKAKSFRKHYCSVLFPRVWQQLTNKIHEEHKQAIEEKDSAITLLNDDLQNRNNRIQAIQYENAALQAQRDVYKAEVQRCQDTIINLRKRYVPYAMDPGKDNILIIIRKHTTPDKVKFHNLSYYIARIQGCNRNVKLRWFDLHFPNHEIIVEIDNPHSIHAFNRHEEEGHTEQKHNHFRLIDLTR